MNNIQWVGFRTLLEKEVRRFLRIWPQTLVPPAMTMSLYFLIFGQLIGGRIGQLDGFSYASYIAPGLVMMAMINNAYANVSSSVFSAKFSKSIEELLVSPLKAVWIVLAFVAGGVLRALIIGTIVTIVASLFTGLNIHYVLVTLSVAVMASMMFAMAGFLNGVLAKSFDDISIIPTFVLTPLIYLGGVFYSIKMLPPFWLSISKFNPILYLINAYRYGLLGVSDVPIVHALTAIVLVLIGLFFSCLYALKHSKGLRP